MVATEEIEIRYAVLNIVATPHPPGVYNTLLRAGAKLSVQIAGNDYGSISEPVEDEAGNLQGRLVIWTVIDRKEPAVKIQDLVQVDFDDLNLSIPDDIGFNCRTFLWSFRVRDHLLFIETRNEFGKSLSPRRAAKFFERLFSGNYIENQSALVEITVVPKDDSLERLLSIPKLKRFSVHLKRPNPDDVTADVGRVLAKLESQGAKSQDTTLVAHSGEVLKPDKELLVQAKVASLNGFVEAAGVLDSGEHVKFSTKEYPRIFKRLSSAFGTALSAAVDVAKEKIGKN